MHSSGPAEDADDVPAARPAGRVVVVTGMSGAGKTQALKSLEDQGYEAVDNLPLSLVGALLRPEGRTAAAVAIGIDIRGRDFAVAAMLAELEALRAGGAVEPRLLFLDCDDETLARRFTETRRRHPLAADRPLNDGIRAERELIAPLRDGADLVIDTTDLAPAELKRLLGGHFGLGARPELVVAVTSFSYRRGVPRQADLVFDTRFLANPHYVAALRPRTGRDPEVAAFIARDPHFENFFAALAGLIAPLLPRFAAEGKSYLTVAIGCTGGRHRSVMVAERLAGWLADKGLRTELRHRDVEEGGVSSP